MLLPQGWCNVKFSSWKDENEALPIFFFFFCIVHFIKVPNSAGQDPNGYHELLLGLELRSGTNSPTQRNHLFIMLLALTTYCGLQALIYTPITEHMRSSVLPQAAGMLCALFFFLTSAFTKLSTSVK